MKLTTLADSDQPDQATAGIRRIFFETSSRQQFESASDEEDYFRCWTAYYLQHAREQVLLCWRGSSLAGYLTGCEDSLEAMPALSNTISSYSLFADLFERFPAHFHINVDPGAQGAGVGRTLVEHEMVRLTARARRGVHVVTAPDADNRFCYQRMGFTFRCERDHEGRSLLFLGRSLVQSRAPG